MAEPEKRFIGRKEYFGSLIYDRHRGDYIPFDWDATCIFEETRKNSITEIAKQLEGKISPQSFQTFIQLCQSIELLTPEGRFAGEFLPSYPIPNILSAPLKVYLSITANCPLKCRHCHLPIPDSSEKDLSMSELKSLFKEMASIGTCELILGGGEPFYREELPEIVASAREFGLNVSISTSGLFVTRIAAKKIADVGIKSFRISFDGSTEKSYDYLRGKGTYRRAMRGIKILQEVFPNTPMKMHTVIMKPNAGELMALLKISQKLNCNTWSIDFIRPLGFAAQNPSYLLSNSEILDAYNAVQRLAENVHSKIEFYQFPSMSGKKTIYRGFGCVGGNLFCHIDAHGNVLPCSFLRGHLPSASIRQKSLKEIWVEGAGFKTMRSLQGNDMCLKCDFFKTCRGGCRARAASSGNINATDPTCFKLFVKNEQSS